MVLRQSNNTTQLIVSLLALLTLICLAFPAHAADSITLLSLDDGTNKSQHLDIKLEILALLTMLSFIPILLMMATPFTRIIIVLSLIRQALGLQQSPPNKVLVGIALVLTIFIMRPIGEDIYQHAYLPYSKGDIELQPALIRAEHPLRKFLLAQTRQTDIEQMLKIAHESTQIAPAKVSLSILLPAYVISELKTAFQIGFLIYLPFLVIDLVVASVLMSMGMMMLSPLIISLPIKLLLFVLADGWSMTVGTLTASFG